MANRPTGFGLTAETTKKIDDKYEGSDKLAIDWINDVLGGKEVSYGKKNVQEKLKDGVILCKVMNILKPGAIAKIHPGYEKHFKQMENIANFLTAAEKYGCARGDMFQSVYLQDGQNMPAVIGGIHALGRKAQTNGFNGPVLGPKEAQANPREISK